MMPAYSTDRAVPKMGSFLKSQTNSSPSFNFRLILYLISKCIPSDVSPMAPAHKPLYRGMIVLWKGRDYAARRMECVLLFPMSAFAPPILLTWMPKLHLWTSPVVPEISRAVPTSLTAYNVAVIAVATVIAVDAAFEAIARRGES